MVLAGKQDLELVITRPQPMEAEVARELRPRQSDVIRILAQVSRSVKSP